MSTLPLELMICYSVLISLSLILKIIKNSGKFKELHSKINNLKKNVEQSNPSINDLNTIIQEFNTINQLICSDEIFFEFPE
jgi:hypothetical protein